ncbi:MAG TPA: PHB depolymerase family esterase [Labilithrix sp.]|nr:PHB depolymerase family esterase [Labilithrix sp.]
MIPTTKTMAWLAGAALLIVACGSSSDDAGAGGPAGGSTTPPPGENPPAATPTTPPGTTPTTPGVPCSGKEALSGDLDWKLTAAGKERVVHVHVPKGYDRAKATPVVLNFHGLGSNADQQILLSGMNDKADQATFVAVHPEGTGVSQSWNAGACCGTAASDAIDDVGFVSKIIDELQSKLCVDARRVFATGMSNGAFLSHRLACELSNRVAAVAPVAGVLGIPTCNPTRPMSVFQFHGTLDGLVPYDGNPTMGFPSVMQTLSSWAGRSGCSTTPRETSKKGEVTCVTFDGCKGGAEVNLCTATGGGHTWPGGVPVPSLGHTTTDINATDTMWDFFVKHPLPQ